MSAALSDSTNTANAIVQEDLAKIPSPQKAETIETATIAAADSTTTNGEKTTENVPMEATVTADENLEAKGTAPAGESVTGVEKEKVEAKETAEESPKKVAEAKDEKAEVKETVEDLAEKVAADDKKEPSSEAPAVMETTEDTPEKEEVAEQVKADVEDTPIDEDLSPEETKKKISDNLIAGRRFMKTDAFNQAVETLSVTAALAAEFYGEAHEETFEINFLYGKALLEVAKMEDGVLTNALTDFPKATEEEEEVQDDDAVENPENVPQEERAEIKKSVEEALGVVAEEPETMDDEQKTEEEKEAETPKEQDEAAESVEDVEMEGVEEEKAAEEEQEAEQAENSDSEDDDESMKLAWELLETARCTCERKLKELEAMGSIDSDAVKVWKLNQADVLTSLGEHGVADSKYEQAQKDLTEAVTIQTAHLPQTSRVLANTTHLLAKAFSLDSLFEKAATHFSDSKNILIAKMEELKKQLEGAAEETKKEIESEIKELEEVIPDLDAFVVDARASAEQTEKIKECAKKELQAAASEISKLAGEEVKDITNMVRRPTKRAASEDVIGAEKEEVKKRRSEDGAETIPDEKAAATPSEESESASAPVTKEE